MAIPAIVVLIGAAIVGVILWHSRPKPATSAPPPDVQPRAWRYIVIHHSASEQGNAQVFDELHRAPPRNWRGLGYHFVIDNGKGGPDGQLEVGFRWKQQEAGAHCKTPGGEYNEYGIGICLVGDFTKHGPTPAQLETLRQLVFSLANEYNIEPRNIIGHRDAPGTHTECPGDALHAYIHKVLQADVAKQQ